MPNDAVGWVTFAGGILGIAAVLTGGVLAAVKPWIESQVRKTVKEAITDASTTFDAKLDGIRLNQAAMSEELGEVRQMETQLEHLATRLENGVSQQVETNSDKIDNVVAAVADLKGWLRGKLGE